MLRFDGVTLRRGPRELLTQATLAIHPGQRVGLVGRNGTGKSSLFAMMRGMLAPDLGDYAQPAGWTVAWVAQETPALPESALEFVLGGDEELATLRARLVAAEAADDGLHIAELHDALLKIDGHAGPARAARLLDGLGFASDVIDGPVASFSGGWRMRLNLARALMCRSDLMLLDEPTNHLDLETVLWLQDWLNSYRGTLLVISHDRDFLDAVTSHTLHLHNQQLTLYTGNYSAFERMRAEQLTQQAATHASQQRRLAHLQQFVDRFRAQATKARQAQSRMKMIERIERIAPVIADSEFSFSFQAPAKLPSPLLRLDEAAVGYDSRPWLEKIRLGVEPGDRIGLLGVNGAGKSTFVRLLAGELAPLSGECLRSPDLRIGYFAQHQLEQLDPAASPLQHFSRLDPRARESDLRDYLGSFNFRGNGVFDPVAPLSGGEKARLALALVVYPRPNLLLLDEPTNHLDLDLRQALELALQEYVGAVILVSHDRHLVANVCDTLWTVADHRVQVFDGDLDDYARWLAARRSGAAPNAGKSAPARTAPAERRRAAADQRAEERSLRDQVRKLDTRISRLGERLTTIEQTLADTTLYEAEARARLDRLLQEQRDHRRQLDEAEEAWLAAAEALETLRTP